jgi:hypothetical protein
MTSELDRLNAALAGRYRIEREIGRGGMATVYRADDLKHDRPVAIRSSSPSSPPRAGAWVSVRGPGSENGGLCCLQTALYPPGKAGALNRELLKAANGGAKGPRRNNYAILAIVHGFAAYAQSATRSARPGCGSATCSTPGADLGRRYHRLGRPDYERLVCDVRKRRLLLSADHRHVLVVQSRRGCCRIRSTERGGAMVCQRQDHNESQRA